MLVTLVSIVLGALCIGLTALILALFWKLIRRILNV